MVIILVIMITYDSVWWFLLPLKKTVTWDSFQKQFLTDLTTIIMNLVEITSGREFSQKWSKIFTIAIKNKIIVIIIILL